jgi:hypothetical protein
MRSVGCTAGYNIESNRPFFTYSNFPSNTLQSRLLQTIESVWIVPEPATILLLVFGWLSLIKKTAL